MRSPSRRVWLLVGAAFAGIPVVVGAYLSSLDEDPVDRVETSDESWSVQDALRANVVEPQAVTGFVHDDGFPMPRLCNGRQEGGPPMCVGPYLLLEGLDAARLDWEEAPSDEDDERRVVRWSREPVTVFGTVTADRLRVTEILS